MFPVATLLSWILSGLEINRHFPFGPRWWRIQFTRQFVDGGNSPLAFVMRPGLLGPDLPS